MAANISTTTQQGNNMNTFLFDGHTYTMLDIDDDTMVSDCDGVPVVLIEQPPHDEYYYVFCPVDNEVVHSSHENNHESKRDAVIMLAKAHISGTY